MSRMTMNTSRIPSAVGTMIVAALIATTVAIWNHSAVDAQDDLKPDTSLSAFMRKKLDASSQVLEGLTTEDAELIQKGAKALLEISRTEKWQILSDPEYREFSLDFRVNARKLADAAEKGNFDNAALQWFDTMKDCIECHRHVRSERLGTKPK